MVWGLPFEGLGLESEFHPEPYTLDPRFTSRAPSPKLLDVESRVKYPE